VEVTSPVATNSPQTVNVTFTITAATTLKVSTVTTGSSLDPDGYTITVFHNRFLRSSSVATNGSVSFTMFGTGSATVSISGVAGNCTVSGSTSRSVSIVAGIENSVTFNISCQASTRRVTLRNLKSDNDLLQDIVQVKVATVEGTPGSGTGVFVREDLLIDDWAECLPVPGPTIPRGQSAWFDPGVNDYYVFIGIGKWETNDVGSCSDSESTWFKRTFATDQNFNLYWSWVVVRVTDHTSGDWEWTISGSYQDGTLVVTPAGNSSISFQLTQSNPIP
jgi:hypothetical protein